MGKSRTALPGQNTSPVMMLHPCQASPWPKSGDHSPSAARVVSSGNSGSCISSINWEHQTPVGGAWFPTARCGEPKRLSKRRNGATSFRCLWPGAWVTVSGASSSAASQNDTPRPTRPYSGRTGGHAIGMARSVSAAAPRNPLRLLLARDRLLLRSRRLPGLGVDRPGCLARVARQHRDLPGLARLGLR